MRRLLFGLLAAGAAAAGSPAQAQGGPWRVSEVTGDVRMSDGNGTRAATRGALLSSGSVIAAARSRAVLVRGRQFVVVSPGSTLRVERSPPESKSVIQMILDAGTALFSVDRRENPHFGVKTRYLAAVVRGTTFSVSVTPAGSTVQVTKGAVQVSTLDGGASELIQPGMIASIGASDLYQLTISGNRERVIRSPNAPTAGAVSIGHPQSGTPQGRITAPVGEAAVRLHDATGGLIEGNLGGNLAALHGRGSKPAGGTDRNGGNGNEAGGSEDGRERGDADSADSFGRDAERDEGSRGGERVDDRPERRDGEKPGSAPDGADDDGNGNDGRADAPPGEDRGEPRRDNPLPDGGPDRDRPGAPDDRPGRPDGEPD